MRYKKLNTEEFIKRSKAKHGDHFDYSETVYFGYAQKLTIICPIHGKFSQRAGHHIYGQGCSQCGFTSMSGKIKTWLPQ